ncbi:MAG: 3-coathanger stack domain-containing protein, partial [Bacteroidota bacterium]
IAGTTSERTPNLDDQAFLMEVDHPSLNVNWTHLYEPKSSFADIAISRNHEGYFMVGDKWEADNNNLKNIYAVKTDANGAVRGIDCCTPIEVPNTQLGFSYLEPFTTDPVGIPAVAIEFVSADFTPEQMFCQDPPPMDDNFDCGWAVATCYAELGTPDVGVIFDTRPNSVAPVGADWNDPALGATKVADVHPLDWKLDSIGQVFGIAIDTKTNPDGDIFLASTDLYRLDGPWLIGGFGPAGSGGIYRTPGNDLDNTTVFVGTTTIPSSPCALIGNNLIPNTNTLANDATNRGNSLGNIAYDEYNENQLFATNTEDGRIYRIDIVTGDILSIYDPFATGSDVPGIVAPSERLWGIGVFEEEGVVKVYFARERSGTNDSEIWSIALDGTGEFTGTINTSCIRQGPEMLEITVPSDGEPKVTDIAFSKSCRIILAERGAAHNAHVREYNLVGTNWDGPKEYYVGLGGDSSAGGIDYGYVDDGEDVLAGCDSMIWATGNYMQPASGQLVYGMQGIIGACNGQNYGSTDLFIDFDQDYTSQEKYEIGDVELFRCKDCPKMEIDCDSLMVMVEDTQNPDQDGLCCYDVDLKNQVGPEIVKVEAEILTPDWIFGSQMINDPNFSFCGAPTATSFAVEHSSGSIPMGTTMDALNFCLDTINSPYPTPQTIVFRWYKAIGDNCDPMVVCADTIIVNCDPPGEPQECVEIIEPSIECDPENPNEYIYCFKVVNNSGVDAQFIILNNPPAGFEFGLNVPSPVPSPSLLVTLDPAPLPDGATSNKMFVKILPTGSITAPTPVCFNVGLLDANLQSCCHSPDTVCTVLEPCCDPCEDNGIFVEDIMVNESDCCKKVDLLNECDVEVFTMVETEVITPGVQFGYHAIGGPDAPNWYIGGASNATNIFWIPNSGFVPTGVTDDIIQFCLDDIDNQMEVPQKVAVNWYGLDAAGNEVILCSDTIMMDCNIEYECLEVTEQEIKCDNENEKYIYCFKITNQSDIPFDASDLILGIESPAGLVFTSNLANAEIINLSPPLGQGDMAMISTCIESPGGFPNGAPEVVFKYRLAYFDGASPDTCCFENVLDTIPLPDCCPKDTLINHGGGTVIGTGVYHSSDVLTSAADIRPGSAVIYKSAIRVELKPGFHAQAGSDFTALIDNSNPCDTCCVDDPLVELDWLQPYVGAGVQMTPLKSGRVSGAMVKSRE